MAEREKILELLKQKPDGLNLTQILKSTGLNKKKVSEALDRLNREGKVLEIVKGCRRTYKIKQ